MAFGYIGSMRTEPGHRDDVVAILTHGQAGLREAGCRVYAGGLDPEDEDKIRVSEVWKSARHHADSLQLPGDEGGDRGGDADADRGVHRAEGGGGRWAGRRLRLSPPRN